MASSATSAEPNRPEGLDISLAMQKIIDRYDRRGISPGPLTEFERLQAATAKLTEKNYELNNRIRGLEVDLEMAVANYYHATEQGKKWEEFGVAQSERADKAEKELGKTQVNARNWPTTEDLLVEQLFASALHRDADQKHADLQRLVRRTNETATLRQDITCAIIDNVVNPAALRVERLCHESLTPEERWTEFKKQAGITQRATAIIKALAEQTSEITAELTSAADVKSGCKLFNAQMAQAALERVGEDELRVDDLVNMCTAGNPFSTYRKITVEIQLDPLKGLFRPPSITQRLRFEAMLDRKFALVNIVMEAEKQRLSGTLEISKQEIERLVHPRTINYMLLRERCESRDFKPILNNISPFTLHEQLHRFVLPEGYESSESTTRKTNLINDADGWVGDRISRAAKHVSSQRRLIAREYDQSKFNLSLLKNEALQAAIIRAERTEARFKPDSQAIPLNILGLLYNKSLHDAKKPQIAGVLGKRPAETFDLFDMMPDPKRQK